jgi:hypothetical protein
MNCSRITVVLYRDLASINFPVLSVHKKLKMSFNSIRLLPSSFGLFCAEEAKNGGHIEDDPSMASLRFAWKGRRLSLPCHKLASLLRVNQAQKDFALMI